MSAHKDQDYFCEGMAEEIINALSTLEGVKVASRTSAFQFKGQSQDIRRIGEMLNVKTVLEGSVRTAGTRLRVTTQLINIEDGYQVGSERYDRQMEDVFDTFARRVIAEISLPLDLRDFPFDRHTLAIEVETVYSSVDEVRLLPLEELSGMADRLSITGWEIGVPTVTVETQRAPRLQIDRSVFRFAVELRRESYFYVWKAIAPLTLIIFMSWAVFWIDPQQIARIGLSATAILTLIAYQFAFAGLLPRVSYLTRADRFTLISSILVFLAMVEAVTASRLTRQGREEASNRLDRCSRVAFPTALAGIIAFSFYM